MAKIKGTVAISPDSKSAGGEVDLWIQPDGSIVSKDYKQALIASGRAFVVNVGAFSTPGTGGGQGTIIDQDQPEFVLDIPSGVKVAPKRILVATQPGAMATDRDETEVLIAVDQDARLSTTTSGTKTTETIYNLDTLNARASQCVAYSLFTANTTNPALDIELAHAVRVLDILTIGGNTSFKPTHLAGFELLYEPDTPVIINGPAKLLIYWGGTVACLAFATVEWYEPV